MLPVHDPLVAITPTGAEAVSPSMLSGGHMVISGWTVAPKGTGGGIQACGVLPCRTFLCRLSAFPGRLMALERERVPLLVKKLDCAPGASYSLGRASCDALCRRPASKRAWIYCYEGRFPSHERKQGHMDKPDPYAELSAAMQKLEAQGVPEADISQRPELAICWPTGFARELTDLVRRSR